MQSNNTVTDAPVVQKVRYRTYYKGIPPRPTKLEVPGWAGEKHWKSGQPWHCKPFIDAVTYGLELLYPFDKEVRVTAKNGESKFEYEGEWTEQSFPFMNFAPNHFGFTSSLDIKTEKGFGTMILPHPRLFTDMTGTVPLPVQGMLESDWWPKIFFIAFKAPVEGQEYVFRKDEGIAQFIFLPKNIEYDLAPMTEQEANQRANCEAFLTKYEKNISTRTWNDGSNNVFDNKYKVLSNYAKRGQLNAFLESVKQKTDSNDKALADKRRNRMKRRVLIGQRKW